MTTLNKRELIALGLAGAAAAAFPATSLAQAARGQPQEDIVFGASVPIAYLISPVAAQITWISLIPISWLLGRYTARWRRATAEVTA